MKQTLLLALILATSLTWAQEKPKDYSDALDLINAWVEAQREYQQLPSVSIAIVSGQQVLWQKAYGMGNVAGKVAATPSTIYSICSISKLFTAIAIMQLYEKGKLRLDDTVESLLPGYSLKQQYAGSGPITVRSLLTHSSGLPREADFPYWTGPDFPFPTDKQVMGKLVQQETLYPASTYFQYSNLGVTLLGEIVEHISGIPYNRYVEENILKPLQLTDTKPFLPNDQYGKKMAIGYSARYRNGNREPVNLFDARGIGPAAGYSSTVQDLGKFASWQFRLLENDGNELLKSSTLKEMQRVHWVDPDWNTTWGLGFSVSRNNNSSIVGHGGSCPGYRTTWQLDPKEKLAYTVMINAGGESPEVFAREIREVLSKVPVERKKAGVDLNAYSGQYNSQPWGSETLVMPWYGELVVIGLPNTNPDESMMRLRHIDGDTFKRVRSDETLGEEVVFERDAKGKIIRMKQHNNYQTKKS
jgi:CubicO group peptidase (beta-lactamase class C family)